MPNWCENDLIIEGPKATLDRIVAERFSDDGFGPCLDFQKVIPVPPDSTVDSQAAAWGTKWLAGNRKPPARRPERLAQTFSTAWSPPLPVLKQLSKQYPGVTVTVRFFESSMPFSGKAVFHRGKTVSEALNKNYRGRRGG